MFLFPSKTVHSVDLKPENNVRTSLAFNVFVKGTFGYTDNLTELILKWVKKYFLCLVFLDLGILY